MAIKDLVKPIRLITLILCSILSEPPLYAKRLSAENYSCRYTKKLELSTGRIILILVEKI